MSNPESTIIRTEKPTDFGRIKELVTEAFRDEGRNVATLVEAIRDSENYRPDLSLVAERVGRVIGHVMLSYTQLEDEDSRHRVLTLSPLAVDPEYQGQGVGGALVKAATQLADKQGEPLVILEGSPKYYPRFGFKYSVPYGISIDLPSWAPAEAAMILPLSHYDDTIKGKLVYPPAFDVVAED